MSPEVGHSWGEDEETAIAREGSQAPGSVTKLGWKYPRETTYQ